MGVEQVLRRRLRGDYEVDPWGFDADAASVVAPLLAARFAVEVHDAERVPDKGAAVVVHNRRLPWTAPLVVALGLGRACGRAVRVVGVPDVAPVGTVLRALGAVPGGEEELASLLRHGEVAGVALAPELRHRHRAGALGAHVLAPAVELGAVVVPVAVRGRELGRRWRVYVGEPIVPQGGAGPLAVAELAERARTGVQALLDEVRPASWLLG